VNVVLTTINMIFMFFKNQTLKFIMILPYRGLLLRVQLHRKYTQRFGAI